MNKFCMWAENMEKKGERCHILATKNQQIIIIFLKKEKRIDILFYATVCFHADTCPIRLPGKLFHFHFYMT